MKVLDKKVLNKNEIYLIAKKYYNEKTYLHVLRVVKYVEENNMIPKSLKSDCIYLAVMHDLLEDTEYVLDTKIRIDHPNFCKALQLITKEKGTDYIEYVKEIKNTQNDTWRECVWWVKIADMKDRLSQTDTLSERLKSKYLNALAYLL